MPAVVRKRSETPDTTGSGQNKKARKPEINLIDLSDSDSDSSDEDSSDDGAPDPEIIWHPFHNNIDGDVIIRSKDVVHFLARSYALRRESSFFETKLSALPNPHIRQGEPFNPVKLHFSASSIALFLDATTAHHSLNYASLSFQDLRTQRKLVLALDCERIGQHVDTAYALACQANPVEWLVAASEDNDLDQAKMASERCCQVGTAITISGVADLMWRIRGKWRHPLVTCLMQSGSGREVGQLKIGWPGVGRIAQFEKDVRRTVVEDSDSDSDLDLDLDSDSDSDTE